MSVAVPLVSQLAVGSLEDLKEIREEIYQHAGRYDGPACYARAALMGVAFFLL